MPPKKGAKKGKKGDDEDFWAAKEAAISSPVIAKDEDGEAPPPKSSKAKANLFDMLEDAGGGDDDEEGGGLMATIRANAAKKAKKSKKKAAVSDDEEESTPAAAPTAVNPDEEWPEDDVKPKKGKKGKKGKKAAEDEEEERMDVDEAAAPTYEDKAPAKASIEDEWPEEDVKPKKGKKGKKGKKAAEDEEEDVVEPAPAAVPTYEDKAPEKASIEDEWPEEDVKPKGKKAKGKKGKNQKKDDSDDEFPAPPAEDKAAVDEETPKPSAPAPEPVAAEAPAAEDEDEEEDEGGVKILSKKEKERLKKEKEKEKKKAQAAKKKAGGAAAVEETPAPVAESPAPAPPADEEDGEGEEEVGGSSKNKKKKKKPAAKAAEPAAPKGKKPSAHVLALQRAMEEAKQKEEEARLAAEAEQRRIDEEEARIEAEEKAVADALAARKAKEKAKRDQLKAEGKLLTPAQKRERAAAEARKAALLASSGTIVAGLQQPTESTGEKKKVVYGSKKKTGKGPAKVPEPASKPTAKPEPTPAPVETPETKKEEEEEDDWDKSEDEAAVETLVAGVDKMAVADDEDDWDKSEDETPAPKSASAPVSAPKAEPKPAAKATAKASSAPKPAAAQKPSAAVTKASAANGKPAPGKVAPAKPESESEESSEEESDSDDDSDDSDDDSDETDSDESSDDGMTREEKEAEERKAKAMEKIKERQKAAEANKSKDDLRSPICCILGHVDTGKTKLLDKIRQTSVQEGEAGGITQQIGATYFPREAIIEKTQVVNKDGSYQYQIPGLLIIDTPGHESFTNLRSRGPSLCNIAILVVDITHGLEPQTIESLNLLKQRKTPFVVALNKIDRMYGWKPTPNGAFRESLALQSKSTVSEFEDRVRKTKLAFAEQGLNAEIFDENKNLGKNISLIPTSAITGEGIPDMLMLLVKLTQERMNARLMYISELECTILEVKVIEGLGTTIDVVLSNGVMREGDKIVLCGLNGPIVTTVRALLTPQPMRELRVKSAYVHHKEVKAALGVKISAPGLEKAIAGSKLYVAEDDDEVEALKDLAMEDLTSLSNFVEKSGKGVFVQASTLGSLEALLTFLQQMKIPVSDFGIGPVYKSTVMKAGVMLDRAPEFAVILSFDVPVDKDASELAEKEGIKIFSAMIIYHLFDAFVKYMAEVTEAKRKEAAPNAVWPVKLSIIRAITTRDPIILGVDILEGTMRLGTPMGVVRTDKETGKREIIKLGKITSIEINHKPFEVVKKAQIGAGAAVKIERASYQAAKTFGRHFTEKDEVVSLITRQSIDTLKENFRDQVDLSDWALIKKMKTEQGVA